MRRPLLRVLRLVPRRLVPPLVWLLALTLLGGLGFRWTLPPPSELRPQPIPASAAPAPRHVTRSLAELGLAGLALAPRVLSDYALLFGRVPKAGAELLELLLQRLQPINGFRLLRLPLPPLPLPGSTGSTGRRLSATEQEELVVQVTDALRREALPVAFHGSVYFTNFSSFDRQSPTFLGLLRDPVERAMSGLYSSSRKSSFSERRRRRRRATTTVAAAADHSYVNQDDSLQGSSHNDAEDDAILLDILERCVSTSATTGRTKKNCAWMEPQSTYFCGHDTRCSSENGEWALRRAMANIDQYYPVVGVLEELNATLAVLERRLPLFFTGIRDVYRHQLHEPHVNWDRKKLENFSPKVRRRCEKRLALEYELYIWAKQRLMLQHFEDSQKEPYPGEAGQDRIAHSIHKRAWSPVSA